MHEPPGDEAPRIGWPRAILTAALIVVVGIVVCVYVPNVLLTRVHSLNRGDRVGLATAEFFVALCSLAIGLRYLQRRKLL